MTPAERNRLELAPLMPYLDELRASGGEPKIVWAANANGYRVGPVPADWEAPFETPPVEMPRMRRTVCR